MNWLKKLFGRKEDPTFQPPTPGIYMGDEAVVRIKWKQADIHNERGIEYFENNEFDKAIEEYRKAVDIRPSPSGKGYQVVGVYTNKPHIQLRGDRSEMHQGALVLNTHGPNARPEALTGEYWTDRKTSGSIHFVSRISELVTRFDDGERLFSSS